MAVIKYSLKKDGDKYIAPHFRVREFRCKDGSDEVLISTELVNVLEKLRTHIGNVYPDASININSGYRTKVHNKKVGGSATSKHIQGKAADIFVKWNGKTVPAKEVCCAAQDLNFDGIGYISSDATHIDVRGSRWWADETKNNKKVADFYAYFGIPYPVPTETVKKGDKGTPVRWVQDKLNNAGYKVDVDGSFGGKTDKAVRKFQNDKDLTIDGKVGKNTRNALKKY